MKLIIDISEDMFKSITKWKKPNDDTRLTLWLLLKNGIPLDKIRAEIEQAADKQFQIAMGVSDLNERYAHIQMENAYRHSLSVIDKYKASPAVAEGSEE